MTTEQAQAGTIEFEAARVAAAFGVGEWESVDYSSGPEMFGLSNFKQRALGWGFSRQGVFNQVHIYSAKNTKQLLLLRQGAKWTLREDNGSEASNCELMARGLYRLGFSDPTILEQLPRLSMHEKLELRLSLPREFWPPSWVEEASQTAF